MNKRTECAAHARSIREVAKEWRESGLVKFKNDKDMIKVHKEDAADMRQVALFLRMGNVKEAFKLSCSLDTIIREEIPVDVWKFMREHGR